MFWKYSASLQEDAYAEVWFQQHLLVQQMFYLHRKYF